MVKIVTDSVSDLPPKLAEELGVSVVPMYVRFGAEVYRDNVDLNTEEFYRKLVTSRTFPATSAPGPGILAETFTKLAKETGAILVITCGSKLSAIHESALQAKTMVKPECQIEVVDSMLGIGGEMLLVILAAKAAQRGASLGQIKEMVKKAIPRTHVRVSFDTLEYLRRGGRIGRAQALLGGVLKVNPVIGLKDGEAFPYGRFRSRAQAIDFLINFAKGFPRIDSIAVEDATTPDELEILVKRLEEVVPGECIYKSKLSPVVGAHVGPHALAVSVLEAE